MADWSSIASEWVETDRRRDARMTLDVGSSSSSGGSRGRPYTSDSIQSSMPVVATASSQRSHRLGPNLMLPSLLARPNSDQEASGSSGGAPQGDDSDRSSVSSMKGMRTLRPVTASYVIELAEGTHQDRIIRERASTVQLITHPTNDPVAMERMYDIFASRKVHLHGLWLPDLWFYTRNSNPFLGLCFAHVWHPYKKLDRFLVLLVALLVMLFCCGVFAARDCCVMELDGSASSANSASGNMVLSLDNFSFADLAADGSSASSSQDGSASIDSILGTLWDSLQSSVSSTDASASTSSEHSAASAELASSSGSSSSSSGSVSKLSSIPSSDSASAPVDPPTDSTSGAGNTMEIAIRKPSHGQYGISETIPIEWTLTRAAGTEPLITQFQIEFSPDGGATFSQIASTVTPSVQDDGDKSADDSSSVFQFDWDTMRTDWYLCTDCVLRICAMKPTSYDGDCIRSDGESMNTTTSSGLTLTLADAGSSDTGAISFRIVNETLVCSCGLAAENYVMWAFIIAICLPLVTRLLQPLVTFYHDSKCCGLFARQGRENVPRLGYYGAKATRKGRLVVILVLSVLTVLSGMQLSHVYKSDTLSTQTDSIMELWGVMFALCVAIGFIYCLLVDSVVFSARWWHSTPPKLERVVPGIARNRSGSASSSSALNIRQLA